MTKTLALCSSASFYEHVVSIADELERAGCDVIIPKSAAQMRERGDFKVRKTWYDDPSAYDQKADYMRSHFDAISRADGILVVNDEKHGVPGYIGPNVLMEMSLAWYQQKPIFMLHSYPDTSTYEEEIKGIQPIVLDNNLSHIIEEFNRG